MNKILMISYQFPPDKGSIQRILNYIKYLPENGWLPIILTHKGDQVSSEKYDKELLKAGIKVYRTGKEHNLQSVILRNLEIANTNPQTKNIISNIRNKVFKTVKTILKKIKNYIIWPDLQVWWIPFAFFKSCEILKKEKINTVYIITPPHSASIIGFLLKKLFTLKLIIDFRDPWANDIDIIMPTAIHRAGHKFVERLIVKSGDAVITTTDYHSQYFNEKILSKSLTKAFTITNGVDLELFKQRVIPQSNYFTITYTGNFDLSRNPKSFLKAVSNIYNKYPAVFNKNSIKFFGNFNPIVEQEINNLGLSQIVSQLGHLSISEVIDEISAATLLLLIVHDDNNTPKFCIPAKLFEYMATGKPILAITPPGAAADIINKYDLGQNIEHHNIQAIEDAILKYYNLFNNGQLSTKMISYEVLNKYDRRQLTKDLAQVLNSCYIQNLSL